MGTRPSHPAAQAARQAATCDSDGHQHPDAVHLVAENARDMTLSPGASEVGRENVGCQQANACSAGQLTNGSGLPSITVGVWPGSWEPGFLDEDEENRS